MRTKKKVLHPAHETEVIDKTKCDLCGREASGENWETSRWSVTNETEISCTVHAKYTESYGHDDGGTGTEITIDICPWCFRDKLVPWLRSQGATVKVEDIDW